MAEGPKFKEKVDSTFEAFRFLGGVSLVLFALFGTGMPAFFRSLFHTGMALGVAGIVGKIGSDFMSSSK